MALRDWLPAWTDPDPGGRVFDERWGTETCRFDLGNYEPTSPGLVEAVLDAVRDDMGGATFLDLGSGKGRVVLVGSQRPFVRSVGIERRPALHAVAVRNHAAFVARGGPVCPVFLLCGDAVEHPLPEGPLVVFLFNPFGGAALRRVLARLAGRPVTLAYVVPSEEAAVRGAGFRVASRGQHGDLPWRVYRRA